MAQYTFTAFRWSWTGYNALYNTSYAAIIDDDNANLDGAADTNETASINGGAFGATAGSPYDINVAFTDVGGNSHVETFYFFNTGGNWYFIPGPGSQFTVGATLGSYQSHTTTPTPYTTITCFVRGTLIKTQNGMVPVEELRKGDNVLAADGSFKELRMSMSRSLSAHAVARNPKFAPVRILAGALGNCLPTRDLLVSRQHRMLVSSKICERMFGKHNVLLAAIRLTELPGIFVEQPLNGVEYFHLLFDRHEVIFAENALSESFYPGPEGIKDLPSEAREEILAFFPEVRELNISPQPAYPIPSSEHQKQFVARHIKNNKSFISCTEPSVLLA